MKRNRQEHNPNRKKKPLDDIINNIAFTYKIASLEFHEGKVGFNTEQDTERLTVSEKSKTISISCKDIERHIFLKAVNIKATQENSLYQFKQLQQELDITSMDELQTKILAKVYIHIIVDTTMEYKDIPNTEKLALTKQFLDVFLVKFREYIIPKIGSEFRAGNFTQFFSTPKIKTIDETNRDDTIANHNWYALDSFFGTSEEKALIECINMSIGNLEKKYETIHLIKNEEIYKIYDFEQGRGFQPDFLLFLKDKEQQALHYQVFIEPKGTYLFEHDKWKEQLLFQIAKKYGLSPILQAEHFQYKLIGLPFFNKGNNAPFETAYQKLYQ